MKPTIDSVDQIDSDTDTRRPWNWVEPDVRKRLNKREPSSRQESPNDVLLTNIAQLLDCVFDSLAVFEQFPETARRGQGGGIDPGICLSEVRRKLVQTESELLNAVQQLKEIQSRFVEDQVRRIDSSTRNKDLFVNVGSAVKALAGWLNIDASGGDLAINVNWGMPLPDRAAQLVYSAHLLEHLRYSDQAPQFVSEVYRILKPGGTARIVVPDIRKLFTAYVNCDESFFESRELFYPIGPDFKDGAIPRLDYLLLYSGCSQQTLNFGHKFGYDFNLLRDLLIGVGFSRVKECRYQGSDVPALRIDNSSYNARARASSSQHFSLFVEATK